MCDQSTVCNLHAVARTAQLESIIKIEKDIEWLKESSTFLYIWNAIDYFIIILLAFFIIILLFCYHYSLLLYYFIIIIHYYFIIKKNDF